MINQINRAKENMLHKKVIEISDAFWEVAEHKIALKTKKGKSFFTCDCKNYSFYTSNTCVHILSVIIFLANKDLDSKIDKLIEDYKRIKDLKMKIDTDIIIDDLNLLRRLK